MKKILYATEIFEENEYDFISLPECLLDEVDEVIKQSSKFKDREEFVSTAIENFVTEAVKEKINGYNECFNKH